MRSDFAAKHTCMGCGVKFYDLHRNPITCPKCGTAIEVETVRPNRRRPAAQPEPEPPPPANADTGVEDAAGETADDDADEIVADISAGVEDALVDGIGDAEPAQPEP